ncbi:hypothetical protein JI752_000935 [Lysobacter sp. MMG2]|nr:hypothetical protein [Lysobacter sp. MMG2]
MHLHASRGAAVRRHACNRHPGQRQADRAAGCWEVRCLPPG